MGRFISVDSYLGRLEEPATQNRYVYVQNNPLLFVDPSGLSATGKRPLGGGSTIPPYIVPINDWANNEPVHEHMWFDAPVELMINGGSRMVTNVGFASSGNPFIARG